MIFNLFKRNIHYSVQLFLWNTTFLLSTNYPNKTYIQSWINLQHHPSTQVSKSLPLAAKAIKSYIQTIPTLTQQCVEFTNLIQTSTTALLNKRHYFLDSMDFIHIIHCHILVYYLLYWPTTIYHPISYILYFTSLVTYSVSQPSTFQELRTNYHGKN